MLRGVAVGGKGGGGARGWGANRSLVWSTSQGWGLCVVRGGRALGTKPPPATYVVNLDYSLQSKKW